MVKRYDENSQRQICERGDLLLVDSDDGDWVRFEDYEALQRQLEEAQGVIRAKESRITQLEGLVDSQGAEMSRFAKTLQQLEEAHAHMRLMRDWMRCADWDAFIRYDHPEAATWDFGEGE